MTRQVVNSILRLQENNRFSKGLFSWVGYKVLYLDYTNRERTTGQTSWSFWSLLRYSVDGLLIFLNFLWILQLLSVYFVFFFDNIESFLYFENYYLGWWRPRFSNTCCFNFDVGGLQLLASGIIGKYLSKTFIEVKSVRIISSRKVI